MPEYSGDFGISTAAGMMGDNLSGLGNDILQKRQTEKANEWNLAMWNLQNEYNDPSAQMARLKAAGLNPNLMYGKGTVGNAESLKPYVTPPPTFKKNMNFGQIGTDIAASMLIPYQKDILKEQVNNMIADKNNKAVQNKLLNENVKDKEFKNMMNKATEELVIGTQISKLNLTEAQIQNVNELNAKIKADTEMLDRENKFLRGELEGEEFKRYLMLKSNNPWWAKGLYMMLNDMRQENMGITIPEWKQQDYIPKN